MRATKLGGMGGAIVSRRKATAFVTADPTYLDVFYTEFCTGQRND